MTNDNTRSKANAVFFSAIMVLSMVAVGFAAAPAAANATDSSSITFDNQGVDGGTVDVDVDADGTAVVVITPGDVPNTADNLTVVGFQNVDSSTTTATVDVSGGFAQPGNQHTAHLIQRSTFSSPSKGSQVPSSANIVAQDDALVGATDGQRQAGEKLVYNGSNVYQGEDDLVLASGSLDINDLEGTSGNREGTPLQLPIATDAETGTYAADPDNPGSSFAVTVVDPRISTAEVQLNGEDIDQVSTANADGIQLEVVGEWNFGEAENVEITVEDESGADITDEVLNNSASSTVNEDDVMTSSGESRVGLNLENEDAGEYTIVFEGTDDLDHSGVVEEYTFELVTDESLGIEVAEDPANQGDNLGYTVTGGTNDQYHLVAIDSSDFRDNIEDNVFRNVDDVEEVGFADSTGSGISAETADDNDGIAYAVVQIDGTQAVGSIRTSALDDSSVDLEVFSAGTGVITTGPDAGSFDDANSVVDTNGNLADSEADTDFDVEEGEVALENPTGTYVAGETVTVNGTADSADNVGIYVRDNNEWEPVSVTGDDEAGAQVISVDSDETFEETDVQLSNGSADVMTGSRTLAFEGRYSIGVVDMSDVQDDSATLNTSAFSSASSNRYTIQVGEGDLVAAFATINGQVAQDADGTVDVSGTATGQDSVVVAFVGSQGGTVTARPSVNDDGTFEEEDIDISSLSQGQVSAHVISIGRDQVVGSGDTLPGSTASNPGTSELETYIDTEVSGSGDQVRSRIIANTIDADGSDDLIYSENIRLNDATLSIRDVFPEEAQAEGVNPVAVNETMVVSGDTNRDPDNAAITVDVLQEDNSLATTSTDEWPTDNGVWSASIDTSELETGTYIVEADDGETTDRVEIEIVETRDTGEEMNETEEEDTQEEEDTEEEDTQEEEDTEEEDTQEEEDTEEEETNETNESDEESTDDSTPGFGAIVALVALLAAALLATRRREE